MTATKPMPTEQQLQAYAQKLPQIYREILESIQQVDPYRRRNEGVFESSLRNHYINRRFTRITATTTSTTTTTTTPQPGDAIPIFGDVSDNKVRDDFSVVLERLADAGFLIVPTETRWGTIVPTELGEELIAVITGKRTPKYDVPELPKPTW
jgi:hypothetical protein